MMTPKMNYETFKKEVAEKLLSYMPEEYQDMQLYIHPVNKVNRAMDGISLKSDNNVCSPTMYIDHMYEEYLRTENLDGILQETAEAMCEAYQHSPVQLPDLSTAKENIVFQFINTMQNQELLKDIPHREFQDLSIIYRWMIKSDAMESQSALIHNNLAETLGLNEEQLFRLAVENTRRILPPVVRSMEELLKHLLMKNGMSENVAEAALKDAPKPNGMYVITNEKDTNGAISILYEDKLHELAMNLDTDLYLLPSSIHEVIAIPANMGEANELAQLVHDVNMNQVVLEERLSNQVYHYDKELRKISLATDTPNKSLTGEIQNVMPFRRSGR